MKKSRGQSIIDFAVISMLAIGIIIFGVYQFGDNLANFFARNDAESKFNNSRTIKFEKPQDLVSNITVEFEGITIEPPVEKIIKAGLSGGTYIQTSGSAGRIGEMGKIMVEYVTQIKKLTNGTIGAGPFEAALDAYKDNLTNGDADGFLDTHDDLDANDILGKKLNLMEMSLSFKSTTVVSNIESALSTYLLGISSEPVRSNIIQTLTNDLLGFDNTLEYFIDPYLYVEYLSQEKLNDSTQDQQLIDAIQAAASGMSPEEKQFLAGQLKIFYGGGYSQASPAAYNGQKMCATFGGTITGTHCTITEP